MKKFLKKKLMKKSQRKAEEIQIINTILSLKSQIFYGLVKFYLNLLKAIKPLKK